MVNLLPNEVKKRLSLRAEYISEALWEEYREQAYGIIALNAVGISIEDGDLYESAEQYLMKEIKRQM